MANNLARNRDLSTSSVSAAKKGSDGFYSNRWHRYFHPFRVRVRRSCWLGYIISRRWR